MDKLSLEIMGEPVSWARPKFVLRGRNVIVFDSQKQEKACFQAEVQNQRQSCFFDDGKHLLVQATFYLPISKSVPTNEYNAFTWGFNRTLKRDVDNLAKFLLDCLNGVVWHDDSQVICLHATKRYSSRPRTKVDIMVVNNSPDPETMDLVTMFSKDQLEEMCYDFEDLSARFKLYQQNSEDYFTCATSHLQSLRLESIALQLALVSVKYHKVLKKIASKYPNFVKDYVEACDG